MTGTLTTLQPTKKKKVALIKPQSSGLVERCMVVGGGLVVVYTFASTLPIASFAALVGIGAYFWGEIKNFQPRETAEELTAILNAKTPKHPSINELKPTLKTNYPVDALNAAIESMLGDTAWVEFSSKDKHELASFGRVYCWINPEDPGDVKLPLQRIEELFRAWGILPTIETQATPATSDAIAPEPLPPAPSTSLNTAPLIERLKAECPELLLLVKAPPIRLVGLQRTGKSSFARKLSLLRKILLPGHAISWSTPHLERDNPLPLELNPVGYTPEGRKDFPAIEALWSAIQAQIDEGIHPNQTVVWDEFGSYDAFQNPELLGPSLRSLLRESSKHQYYPIIIAHGDQAGFYPGITGILTTLKQSTVKVETIGAPADDFGTMRPAGKVRIHDLHGNSKEVQIPDWLTEEYLLAMLRGVAQQMPTAQAEAPSDRAAAPIEATEPHEVKEVEAASPEELLSRRVGQKLAAKLKSSGDDWLSLNSLIRDNFSGTEDREIARKLIKSAIAKGKLEYQERENPNRTKTTLVRVSIAALPNRN